jgi:peptidyl-prolyl cis-trans isomerase A (cyclophilin A)
VIKGMDVVDKIAALPTRALGPFAGDVPDPLVLIESAHVIGEEALPAASTSTPAKAASMPAKPAAKKVRKAAKPTGNG